MLLRFGVPLVMGLVLVPVAASPSLTQVAAQQPDRLVPVREYETVPGRASWPRDTPVFERRLTAHPTRVTPILTASSSVQRIQLLSRMSLALPESAELLGASVRLLAMEHGSPTRPDETVIPLGSLSAEEVSLLNTALPPTPFLSSGGSSVPLRSVSFPAALVGIELREDAVDLRLESTDQSLRHRIYWSGLVYYCLRPSH